MSLRRKLKAFMGGQKKAEYTELAYLESNGNQYINLGIIPNNTMGVKAKFYVNSADGKNYVIGSRGIGVGRFYLYSTESSPTDVRYGWGTIWTTTGITPVVGTPVEASLNYLNDRKYIYNGTEVNSNLPQSDFSGNTYDMYLFSSNFANVFYNDAILNGRIYYCQITQGDKVIMDLIPVLDKDLVPCMYDKVTSKYFYNQGDGEFKWKLPNQLECLESYMTQYILTDYYPNPNTAVEVDYLPSETHQVFTCIFGTQDNAQANRFYTVISATKYRLQVNTYGGNMYYGLNTNGTVVQGNNGNFTSNRERVLLKLDCFNKTVSVASDSYTNTYDMSQMSWGDCNCSYPLVIFNRSTTGVITATNGYRGRIYSFKIWESDKLLHYYIPAFDENLNVCMYDLVSKTYLYNQGTGLFKGYFEDDSQLVGYLKSTGTQYIDTSLIANQLINKTLYIKMKNTGNSGNYAYNGAYDAQGTGLTVQFGLYATNNTQCRTTQNYFDPSYTQTTGLDKSLFHELQMDKTTYWLNGEVVATHEQTDEEKIKTCVNRFLIFGRSQKNSANSITPMAISRFWVKNADGSYLQNLVPVVKSDNTICMLDLISKQCFVNQGTGSFTYDSIINQFNATNPSYVAGYISTNNGGNITASTLTDTFYIPCKPNTTYWVIRSSVNVSGQVWRAATVTETPRTGMLCPNYVGGLNNNLTLTITSRANDKYLMFSEGQTMATDNLTKFTVVELGSGS